MTRIVAHTRTRLIYVESRGWLLGKLGIGALVMAGVVLVWGPLVAGRPHAMSLAGWLAWAAIALVVLGAIVRSRRPYGAPRARPTCSSALSWRPWDRQPQPSEGA